MVQAIVPYMTVKSVPDAIDYYKKAFGATENSRSPEQDGKRILHADLTIHGGTIFLMDEFPEHGSAPSPTKETPAPVGIVIQLSAPKDVDSVFKQAVEAGGTGTMEPADMFWGARFASLTDPFGHSWMFNSPLPQK